MVRAVFWFCQRGGQPPVFPCQQIPFRNCPRPLFWPEGSLHFFPLPVSKLRFSALLSVGFAGTLFGPGRPICACAGSSCGKKSAKVYFNRSDLLTCSSAHCATTRDVTHHIPTGATGHGPRCTEACGEDGIGWAPSLFQVELQAGGAHCITLWRVARICGVSYSGKLQENKAC